MGGAPCYIIQLEPEVCTGQEKLQSAGSRPRWRSVTSTNVSSQGKTTTSRLSRNVPSRFKGQTSPWRPRQTESDSPSDRRKQIRAVKVKTFSGPTMPCSSCVSRRHIFNLGRPQQKTCNPGSSGASLCHRSALNQTASRPVNTTRLGAFKELWKLSAGVSGSLSSATDIKGGGALSCSHTRISGGRWQPAASSLS